MANNCSPGSDGFTAECFQVFWGKLGHFILRSLNYGYMKGELSVTQKEGIITSIPKPINSISSNYRPIYLLKCVYKIGAIANRIKKTL